MIRATAASGRDHPSIGLFSELISLYLPPLSCPRPLKRAEVRVVLVAEDRNLRNTGLWKAQASISAKIDLQP